MDSKKKRGRGRNRKTFTKKDKNILDVWKLKNYATKADLAVAMDVEVKYVEDLINCSRMRNIEAAQSGASS